MRLRPVVLQLPRAAVGAVLIVRAVQLVRALTPGRHEPPGAVALTRALGVRYVVQAGALAVHPSLAALRVAVAADALHLGSMILPAVGHTGYRRLARPAFALAVADLAADLGTHAAGVRSTAA